MKKIFIFVLMAAGLLLGSCENSTLDPLSGDFLTPPTVVTFTKVDNSEAYKDADGRWIFNLDLSDDAGTKLHAVLVGNKYFLTSNTYSEAPVETAKNGNFIVPATTVNGQAVRQGNITVKQDGTNYTISSVLFLSDGTPYKTEWIGTLTYEEPQVLEPEFFYTDTVAQDCTLEDGQTLVTDVESHTLVLKDKAGEFAAQIKLIRTAGTATSALAGTYTVKEYAHEDFSAGNGFDLGVYFGLDPGAYVIGSYYVSNGTVAIIEPGETITVTDMGDGVYSIDGSGFSFLTAPEGFVPDGGDVYDMTDTVAQDCTLEDGQTLVEDVESHTLVMKKGDDFIAQIKLIRSVGTTDLTGTYTVKEYAHEDLSAGNGFDLGVYFGMDPGAYVIGSYYMADGAVVIIEPGETITVTSTAENTYKFEGSTDWSFTGKLASDTPGPEPENVSLFLNEFETTNKKLEIYNAGDEEVDMTGWTLSKDETVWTIPAEHAKVPAKGYIVYTGKSDGSTDPTFGLSGTKGFVVVLTDKDGNIIDKVDNSADREGGIVQIPEGKSWGRETDGAENFVIFDTPTIGASNGSAAEPEPENVELTEFLSLTDYFAMYNVNLVGMELGTAGFHYTPADWVTTFNPLYPVDGNFLKLELYTADGKVAPGTYKPCADANALAPGEFKTGSEGWGSASGTAWYTVANGTATYAFITDGTVEVSVEGDVYTIDLKSSVLNAKYVGKLSADTPGPEPENVSLFLNEFETENKKIEIYNAGDEEVDMTGWTLSKDETDWVIPAEHAKVPAKGYIVYTGKSDGSTDPTFGLSGTKGFVVTLADKNGNVIDKVDNSADREGGIVQIPDGKSWGRETDGAENFVIFDTPTIGAANEVVAPPVDDSVELTEFLSVTDYFAMYNVNLVGMELGTAGFHYTPADWQTTWTPTYPVDGNYIKLELYTADGKVAPGTYKPCADANALAPGEFKTGSEGWGGASGSAWYTVKKGAATYDLITDGTVEVSLSGDVYTIVLKSTAVNIKYVGKLSEGGAAATITIDGDMSDWAAVEGASGTGINAAFKVASDEDNIYFYVKRTTERMADLWGGNGYHYYCFDMDNDPTSGVELWGNGPYELLLVVYPYAGSADAPAFGIAAEGTTMPDYYSVNNAVIKGVVTDSGVETEIAIPRADLPAMAGLTVNVYEWSNKGGSDKLEVTVAL